MTRRSIRPVAPLKQLGIGAGLNWVLAGWNYYTFTVTGQSWVYFVLFLQYVQIGSLGIAFFAFHFISSFDPIAVEMKRSVDS